MAETVFAKGERNQIRVYKSDWKGRTLLHIREWYQESGEWKPGKGIALRLDQAKAILEAALKEVS